LARILGVNVGDKVTVVTPSTNVTPAGVTPRMKRFKVTGIFYVGMSEYDTAVAFIHMHDAQVLYRLGESVTGVRAKIDDLFEAPFVAAEIKAQAMGQYWVRDWTSSHANWFRAVQIEKRMIFLLLLLIIIVAAVNMVSMLVMVVTDKRSDIAILRTLGATPLSITKVFIVQGAVIGTVGTLLGVVGGVSLALNLDAVVSWIEQAFNFRVLPSGVYYITELPSDLHWNDVWLISAVSFTIGLVATLYPAWRAAKTDPAQALRYE
ncbi:MAG: cell division protein FtsX, partial [Gammaproteobacteria bacterium SG8_47]